jgi:hypothetical protein
MMGTEMISIQDWIQPVSPQALGEQASIPIRVLGFDPGRIEFSEDSHAVSVGPRSARIALKNWVVMGDILRIVNLENYYEADFRIVGPTSFGTHGDSEWVVVCVEKGRNIWGSQGVAGPAEEALEILLECRACHQQIERSVNQAENQVLEATGMIVRNCAQCGQETYWTYADATKRPPAFPIYDDVRPPARVYKTKGFVNTRKHKRLLLRLPVLVRNSGGQEEISTTDNISMGGLAAQLHMGLEVNQIVTVICPYLPNGQNIEQKAECRWGAEYTSAGGKRIYGFRYLE